MKKNAEKFCWFRKKHYLCTRNSEMTLQQHNNKTMGYGVMVTLQILVLSFLVRVRVSQLRASFFKEDAFLFYMSKLWLRNYHYIVVDVCWLCFS